ncbi:MAG: four helix bundle protein [Ferruginibacter sp.]
MKENVIKHKSFLFAVRIVKLYQQLCDQKKEYVLSKQLLRSGTSVGAMVREAEHAETRNDFRHKLGIAQKEINESIYWLDLLNDPLLDSSRIRSHKRRCYRNNKNCNKYSQICQKQSFLFSLTIYH